MIEYTVKIDLQGERVQSKNIIFTAGDSRGYRLNFSFYTYGTKLDVSDCTLVVKAKRKDEHVITDAGVTEGTEAYYIVADNMYAVPGNTELEAALVGRDQSVVTTCVLRCFTRPGFGEGDITPGSTSPFLATLAEKAMQAADSAAAAAEAAKSVTAATVPYDAASSKLTATTVQGALDELSQKLYAVAGMSELTWSNVQKLVRSGLAPQVFSVGDQLICNHTKYGELVWDIIDFDHDAPTDTTKTHSMSLQLHHIDELLQFDASEALYHAENGLAAGTYHFTVPAGYDENYGGGKTYQFTLTKAVPTGGHLKFLWAYHKNASDCKLESTPSPSVTVPIESVSVTEGDGGTALTALNSFGHARFGSEKWKDSCARQWLNSAAAAGAWWTPQHAYDRPYSADLTGKAGFLNGMDADFLAVVGTVTKRTAFLDSTYEDSTEKFFLPSPSEIYGGNDSSVNEGAPYAYYADNSTLSAPGSGADSNRIKCAASGAAGYWWLRSTRKNIESFPYAVLSKGQITNGSFAYNTMRMAPVCNII